MITPMIAPMIKLATISFAFKQRPSIVFDRVGDSATATG